MKKETYVPFSNRMTPDRKRNLDLTAVQEDTSVTKLLEEAIDDLMEKKKQQKQKSKKND